MKNSKGRNSKIAVTGVETARRIENTKNKQHKALLQVLNKTDRAYNMRQLALLTLIDRASICRRLSELQERGVVVLRYRATCPISKYPKVNFYGRGRKDGK